MIFRRRDQKAAVPEASGIGAVAVNGDNNAPITVLISTGRYESQVGVADRVTLPDVGTGSAGWLTRSGYREQVRDIAPRGGIQERESELDELARFCAGPESYLWWRAAPWAGKSALMSSFVLHPPSGVVPVAFFVTGRLAGQDDAAAYTAAVLAQLGELLDRPVPARLGPAERDALRRAWLAEAGEHCQRAGRQLVLVVDGLDEDRGPGRGQPSIASLLPKNAGPAVKVIVAAREQPVMPPDIPADHPLREQHHVRPLAVSAHARAIQDAAERDLQDLLHGAAEQRDLLGLVAAAGGGLTRRDLEELTGLAPYQIGATLHGVTGRTFTTRVSAWDAARLRPETVPVYLLAHENLQTAAVDQLGRERMRGYRERLHAWADTYRAAGWPRESPLYLLQGYHRMLDDTGDLLRLLAYTTDRARHNRMLDQSGGDVAALAEVSAARAAFVAQESIDLGPVLMLAYHQDELSFRNVFLPATLPAVWALLGDDTRAEALAYEWSRMLVLARVLTNAGQFTRAANVARAVLAEPIAAPEFKVLALTTLAVASAGAEHAQGVAALLAEAHALTDRMAADLRQAQALAHLVRASALTGHNDQVVTFISRIEAIARAFADPIQQGQVLVVLVDALSAAGHLDRVDQVVEEARAVLNTVDTSRYAADPPRVLADLAATLARTGRRDRAQQLATEAEDIAATVTASDQVGSAFRAVSRALASVEQYERAEALARAITFPLYRAEALAEIAQASALAQDTPRAERLANESEAIARTIASAELRAEAWADLAVALAAAGHLDRADAVTQIIADPFWRVTALAAQVPALAHAGQHERARQVSIDAETTARTAVDRLNRSNALSEVAQALAAAGQWGRAEAIAISLASWHRSESLAALAGALAQAEQLDRARTVAATVTDPVHAVQALLAVAAAAAQAGNLQESRRLANEARTGAAAVPDWRDRAVALAAVSGALHQVGAHRDAVRTAEEAQGAASAGTAAAWQALVLADLIPALADGGHLERAEQIAAEVQGAATTIDDAADRSLVLAALAAALHSTGHGERAARLAGDAHAAAVGVADLDDRHDAIVTVAGTLSAAGALEPAATIAKNISDPYWRALTLAELVPALVHAGRTAHAQQITTEIAALADVVDEPEERIRVLAALSVALADVGHIARAHIVAADVEAVARNIDDVEWRARVMAHLVGAGGHPERIRELTATVEALAQQIADAHARAGVLIGLAHRLAGAGHFASATQIIRGLAEPAAKASALAELARTLTGRYQLEQAIQAAVEAEAVAHRVTEPEDLDWTMNAVARAFVSVGHHRYAEHIARQTGRPRPGMNGLLKDLSKAFAEGGLWDRAEAMARMITFPDYQAAALAVVARALADTKQPERALRIVADAQNVNQCATNSEYQASTLSVLAGALSSAGHPAHARRLVAESCGVGSWHQLLQPVVTLQPSALTAVADLLLAAQFPASPVHRPQPHSK